MQIRKTFIKGCTAVSLILLGLLAVDAVFWLNAKDRCFDQIQDIPKNKVGVLLGVSKYINQTQVNPFYQNRLDAAVALYKSGKIEHILISGDNSRCDYNEPATFKNDLLKLGVADKDITLDYAGFRTLDTTIRAKEIFGLQQFTFISQRFHNQRALLLADAKGLEAIAFNALDVLGPGGKKAKLREYLARPVALLDLLFNTQPKYLGLPQPL